jgi:hypothetical protein
MTYREKGNRLYPYNTGLKLGSEIDIVLTNENSEPVDALQFFDATQPTINVEHTGGGEEVNDHTGQNHFKALNGMVRMYSMLSYCRAYSTDNIWYMMKHVVGMLKKRAFISYVPAIYGEDFENLEDGKAWTAAGHMRFHVQDCDIYDNGPRGELVKMTYNRSDESHGRLLDNLRITIGLISLLLDRRESAEFRRQEYGPFNNKEFRKTSAALTYQTPTNWWLFSPMLSHLMFGAARWAYFMTQNNFECDVWDGFESGDIKNAIHYSDYDTGREIWDLMKHRIQEAGYIKEANPFAAQPCAILEMLFENGMGAIGDGVYKNWRMDRRLVNFRGHFDDLPSWENGAVNKVFKNGHPMFKTIQRHLEQLNAK